MTYKDEIINKLIDYKNGLELTALVCEVLGEEYPGGIVNRNFHFVVKDVMQLVESGELKSKKYDEDILIVSIGDIPEPN